MADEARPRGLGRGLSALIGEEAPRGGNRAPRTVPTAFLRPNKFQPRKTFAEGDLADLIASVKDKGILQPLLVRSLGAVPGIALAAAAFGLLHYQEYGNSWRHVLIIAMAGAAFGWMRHLTGSTKAAAIMHAAYNSLFFIALMTEKRILPHLW